MPFAVRRISSRPAPSRFLARAAARRHAGGLPNREARPATVLRVRPWLRQKRGKRVNPDSFVLYVLFVQR